MESNIDIISRLRIKPLPSTNKVYDFFLAKNVEKDAKEDIDKEVEKGVEKEVETVIENFPPIIDKTDEDLIDYEKFMKNLVEKTIINKTDLAYTQKSVIEDTISSKQEKSIDQESFISNIIKTSEKIFIVIAKDDIKAEAEAKIDDQYIKDEEIEDQDIKETKTKAKKLINDDDENIDLDKYYDLESIITKKITTNSIQERLKDKIKYDEDLKINISPYYLYNREIYITSINNMFDKYKEQLLKEEQDILDGKITVSCDKNKNDDFSLLLHQKIVKDYLNLYSPYRGLLLYHGLGSGKTCSSIAIAE